MQQCPECKKIFDPADRATPITPEVRGVGHGRSSVECKRKAGNRRNYQRHREERLAKAKTRKDTQP